MATLPTPYSSPSSLQLRLGSSRSASLFLKIRPDSRLRWMSLSSRGRMEVRSSSGPLDGFSGWSGSDNGDGDKMRGIGGILGAGLAGALFLASISFASFSFSVKGSKTQMEPLTSAQTAQIISKTENNNNNTKDLKEEISDKENLFVYDLHLKYDAEEIGNNNISSESSLDDSHHKSENDVNTPEISPNEEEKPLLSDINNSESGVIKQSDEDSNSNSNPNLNLSLEEPLNAADTTQNQLNIEKRSSEISISESGDVIKTEQSTTISINQIDPLYKEDEKDLNEETEKGEGEIEKVEETVNYSGIPAPSLVTVQAPAGKVLVPAVVDQNQSQAFSALQVLKVIEGDAKPGDLCTRREYARWLVASSSLSRSTVSKVYPAMYIENVTELAFDDVTPDDPDFSFIQGLAEAGLISSKLSRPDEEQDNNILFSPESPLSRQDLVSWKMALEKRLLPEVNKNSFYKVSGYIDIDKINPDAWPALASDLSAGEQSITSLAFGYTRLFQPGKPVTKSQAAIALSTGESSDAVHDELLRIEADALAESAVSAHSLLVSQVEKDLNASFQQDLLLERQKVEILNKLAEEAREELRKLREEREEEEGVIKMGRAAVESEMEVMMRVRGEMERELEGVMGDKMEVRFEKERVGKIRKEIEEESERVGRLKYELEVERKALNMARAWAEEEAKRARDQAKALEEARSQWEQKGIKVLVDESLQDDTSAGISWVSTHESSSPVKRILSSGLDKARERIEVLKESVGRKRVELIEAFGRMREKVVELVEVLKRRFAEGKSAVSERGKRVLEECKEGVEKITQKPKS
ncbi:hypothetical protein LUZ60_016778 [Juncus effusus]|nr:hypothetical protein LUZ60_016778 [Juncus effusus]